MVTQKFDLNMIPGKPKPIIRASQYDTGLRAFEVSLFAGTDTYTIPSGATLTVQGTKPDYTGFSYSATYSGNTVTFDCTDQMTACAGAVEMEIAVVNEGERVATANFVLQVEPAALKDDTIISETDIPIIEQLPEMMEDMGKLISTFGGPNVAETAAEMTDQDKVYVYIGSETGYNSGHWYYYDKTAHVWKDGGVYQSAGMDLDTTLSVSGRAADAKAVGDALALKANLASPTFTGCPKAPTASLISYGTQIANTEFVQRLVMPLDDAVNGLEPTEIEMHLVVDGTTGTWAQGGKTNIYDLLPGDNVEVTAGERDAYLVWYTTQGGTEAVIVSSSHTVTVGATGRWGTTDARRLAVLMEDTSGNDVSPAHFAINGVEKGLNERVDALETTTDEAKAIALKAFATPTASGTVVAIEDGADNIPVKSLILNIIPHQDGTGDPNPDNNVRPISGYNAVTVTRTGMLSDTYTIAIPAEVGAFYGGTLTVDQDGSGTLTVDKAKFVTTWGAGVASEILGTYERRRFASGEMAVYPYINYNPVCNIAPLSASYGEDSLHFYINNSTGNNTFVFLPVGTPASTEIEVAYELANPTTYTFTAQEVTTLIGNNSVSMDADGTITIEYRADTEALLEKKQDVLTFDTVPTEDSTNPVTSGGVYTVTDAIEKGIADAVNYANLTSVKEQINTPGNVYYANGQNNNTSAAIQAYSRSDFIRVAPGCVVRFSGVRQVDSACVVAFYDPSKTYVQGKSVQGTGRAGHSGEVKIDAFGYVRLGCRNVELANATFTIITKDGEEIAEVKDATEEAFSDLLSGAVWELGSINVSGIEVDSTVRVRSNYIPVDLSTVSFEINEGYHIAAVWYNAVKGTLRDDYWYSGSVTLTPPVDAGYLRLVVAKIQEETATLDYGNQVTATGIRYKTKPLYSLTNWLPEIWETYLDSKIPEIKTALMALGSTGVAFTFVTDVHAEKNNMYTPVIMRRLERICPVDYHINGGDYIWSEHTESAMAGIDDLCFWNESLGNLVEYPLRGNHDNNNYDGENPQNVISASQFYAIMTRRIENLVNTEGKTYYCIDNESQKVRLICLDTSLTSTAFTAEMAWMQTKLTEKNNTWTIMIIQHYLWGGTTAELHQVGQAVINAVNDVYTNISAAFVGILGGHTHVDYNSTEQVNGYLLIARDTDIVKGNTGTAALSFDYVMINTSARTINFKKIGRGSDLSLTY